MNKYSDYLYQKASINKIPLFGCLELSPVCNFSCKMCYVRKTTTQIKKEGKSVKNWTEWLELAKQMKEAGTLYLLLTGGEPFIYPNFRKLYEELHKMGFIISINTNGTMIDYETLEWLKLYAPSRVNITLYGSSRETYQKLCGNPDGYDKAVNAILSLKKVGIPVVINASMIPENVNDMKDIIEFGKHHNINTRVSTYMFKPIRRESEKDDSRFTSIEAGNMCMEKYKYQLNNKNLKSFIMNQLSTIKENRSDNCDNWGTNQDEYMRCRAGRSSFWISWTGKMTACGMLPFPIEVNPFEERFTDCWMSLTNAVRSTTVLEECKNCSKKEICNPCVAMLYSETKDVNKKASYLCEMTDTIIYNMKNKLVDWDGGSNV